MLNVKELSQLFDCIRLIDVEIGQLRFEYTGDTAMFVPKFEYNAKRELYLRCLASDAAVYQFEQVDAELFLVVITQIRTAKERLILECIANVTGRMDISSLLDQREISIYEAYKLSVTDELTGLYNRRYINQMLPVAISTCVERKLPLSVLFADLDYFKDINDSYGHAAGDYILYEFVKELESNLGGNLNWAARYGGDEFMLCLPGADKKVANTVAENIRKSIEERAFVYNDKTIKTTCSLGIYTFEDFYIVPTCDFIIKKIDERLYQAKKAGRNKVR